MPELQNQFPDWLNARYAKHAGVGSPWLDSAIRTGMQREEMRQKLPLQLQEMALRNKANALEVESRGLQNDLANMEMDAYREDLPVLREAMAAASSVPGGATGMPVPQFRSRQAQAQWLQRQNMDAQLVFNKAFATDQIELTKLAAELTAAGHGDMVELAKEEGPNGTPRWSRSKLGDIASRVNEDKAIAAIELRKAGLRDTQTMGDPQGRLVTFEDGTTERMVQTGPNSWQKAPINKGIRVITHPDGSQETIVGGSGGDDPSALTKANLTKAQESQAQSLATIDVANRLEPLISTETVGMQAFAESWVKDRLLAQRFPEMASDKRAKAEQLVAELRTSAVNELGTPPISDRERAEILKSVPGINDPVDSPVRARQLLANIRKMSAIRALVVAKRMGTGVPKSAAAALDDETLADLFNQGLITQEQAREAYELKGR